VYDSGAGKVTALMNYDVGTVGRGGPVVRRSSRRLPDACPVVDAHAGSGRDRPPVRCRGSAGRPPRPDGTPSRTSARRSPLRTAGTSRARATSPASTTSKRCARLSRARSTRSRSSSRPPVTARLSRPEGPRRRHDHCDVVVGGPPAQPHVVPGLRRESRPRPARAASGSTASRPRPSSPNATGNRGAISPRPGPAARPAPQRPPRHPRRHRQGRAVPRDRQLRLNRRGRPRRRRRISPPLKPNGPAAA
jgi:hypothetical protein